tara:strand:- start:237 stop:407 length:171 start_codon:yes stop_codon:yes gene_type:complete
MKKLFLFFFLVSCSSFNSSYDVKNNALDFKKDLSFDEFNQLLIKYNEITSFPNINK